MRNVLYSIAVIFIISWVISFLEFTIGGLLFLLLVIAVLAIIRRFIRGEF